jgi:hypothetical protein
MTLDWLTIVPMARASPTIQPSPSRAMVSRCQPDGLPCITTTKESREGRIRAGSM